MVFAQLRLHLILFIRHCLIFFGIALTTGCLEQQRQNNVPVLKVYDRVLTAKQFAERLARELKVFDALSAKNPENIQRVKSKIIRDFVLESLLIQFSKEKKIEVSRVDLDKEVDKTRSSYPDDLSFRQMLASEGLSLAEWTEQLKIMLIQDKVFALLKKNLAPPTQDEVLAYYNSNKAKYKRRERIFLRQIVLDEETKADSVYAETKNRAFADLAKDYSVAPESKQGGLVGWIERGQIDIFDKAFSLPVGGVSQVLNSEYGFHIFKVEKKEVAGFYSLDEVRDTILDTLTGQREQAAFTGWLDQQARLKKFSINQSVIDQMIVETKGEKS